VNIKPKSIDEIYSKLRPEKKTFAKGTVALRVGLIPKALGITCSPNEGDLTCIGLTEEYLHVSIGCAKFQFTTSKGRRPSGHSRHNYVYSPKSFNLARMDKWLTEAAEVGKATLEVVTHGGD